MTRYSLMQEMELDTLREKAFVIMEYIKREDLNRLQKEFEEYTKQPNANPWYVWLMCRVEVTVTPK